MHLILKAYVSESAAKEPQFIIMHRHKKLGWQIDE